MPNISRQPINYRARLHLVEQLKRETGVTLGGTLYSDALSDAKGPAATYLKMMEHNLETLLTALEQ